MVSLAYAQGARMQPCRQAQSVHVGKQRLCDLVQFDNAPRDRWPKPEKSLYEKYVQMCVVTRREPTIAGALIIHRREMYLLSRTPGGVDLAQRADRVICESTALRQAHEVPKIV